MLPSPLDVYRMKLLASICAGSKLWLFFFWFKWYLLFAGAQVAEYETSLARDDTLVLPKKIDKHIIVILTQVINAVVIVYTSRPFPPGSVLVLSLLTHLLFCALPHH